LQRKVVCNSKGRLVVTFTISKLKLLIGHVASVCMICVTVNLDMSSTTTENVGIRKVVTESLQIQEDTACRYIWSPAKLFMYNTNYNNITSQTKNFGHIIYPIFIAMLLN